MRVLVLTSSGLAPTYNERTLSQIEYINNIPGMYAELCNDLPLCDIERKLIDGAYDCVFPAVVFERSTTDRDRFFFNTALYKILLYHKQDYIGSDIYTQLLLNDKALTNQRSGMGLPGKVITRVLWENRKSVAQRFIDDLSWPVLIKPNTLSASMGISEDSIAHSLQEAATIIDAQFQKFPTQTEVLLEKYVENAHEYTVSVTGNEPWTVAVPTALEPESGTYEIYSSDSKRMAIDQRPIKYHAVPDVQLSKYLSECAVQLAKKLALRDYSRFDFLVDESQHLFLIDANTIPALGRNYMYSCTSSGVLRVEQLLALLLAVFSKRTGKHLPVQLLQALPQTILAQLGL